MSMESNKYSVKILPEAETNLREIFDYIVNNLCNPQAAEKLMSDIMELVDSAACFPYSMPEFKNSRVTTKDYRRIVVKNYAIIYKVVEEVKEIRLMAVFYAPSNYPELFNDKQ